MRTSLSRVADVAAHWWCCWSVDVGQHDPGRVEAPAGDAPLWASPAVGRDASSHREIRWAGQTVGPPAPTVQLTVGGYAGVLVFWSRRS